MNIKEFTLIGLLLASTQAATTFTKNSVNKA